MDDQIRILPQGVKRWFSDYVSPGQNRKIITPFQDEAILTTQHAFAAEGLKDDEVLPLDDTSEDGE